MSVRPLRLFVIAIGLLGASLAALATVVAPSPASADSFEGWTYDVSVGASDGLRLTNVSYDGVKIFDRVSLPVMNVFYQNDRCGPYTDKVGGSSYQGPFGEDFTLDGVRWRSIGITDFIGQYEITMYYYLSENGDFDAHMFSRGVQCNFFHEHYPYWRFDFDVAGAANDEIVRLTSGGTQVVESQEFSRPATDAAQHGWEVRDSVTGDRVTIAFDDGTFTLPGTVIPETDYENNWVHGRQYSSSEVTWSGGARRGSLWGDNGQTMSDVVLWYTGYMPHSASEGPSLWHSTGVRLRVNPSDDGQPATIGDQVSDLGGDGVGGVAIDLFEQQANGSRGAWLGSTTTASNGGYSFTVDPGCYVVVFIAPDGQSWTEGGRYLERGTCVGSGEADLAVDAVLAAGGSVGEIGDRVSFSDGSGVSGVAVDLFSANPDGSRVGYLRSTVTDGSGNYSFAVEAGDYVVVFIAPAGQSFVGGGGFLERAVTIGAGESNLTVDAVLAGGAGSASIGDRVTTASGSGVAGVVVDLFAANADGSRGAWLGDDATDGNGNYDFAVPAGCYVVVFIAPPGQSFQGGGAYLQRFVCVAAGESNNSIDAVLN